MYNHNGFFMKLDNRFKGNSKTKENSEFPKTRRSKRFRIRNKSKPRKNIKLVHLLPNVLTSFNVACGVSSIILSIEGRFELAAVLILLAAFFDLIDGKVARFIGASSPFGVQLDSLADVISFGVAPPVVMHTLLYQQYDRLGLSLVLVYTLCTTLRLARYNVQANNQQKRSYFTGLPCPVPACFLASVVLISTEYGVTLSHPILRTSLHIAMIGLACLMVSTVKYPDLSALHLERKNLFQHNVFMVLILCVTVLIFKVVLFLLTVAFIISGPAKVLNEMWQKHYAKKHESAEQSGHVPQQPLIEHK